MELNVALEKISEDKELTKSFLYDPKGALGGLDVDMTDIKIEPATELSFEELSFKEMAGISTCISIGAFICISVGSDIPDRGHLED